MIFREGSKNNHLWICGTYRRFTIRIEILNRGGKCAVNTYAPTEGFDFCEGPGTELSWWSLEKLLFGATIDWEDNFNVYTDREVRKTSDLTKS